MKKIKPYLFYVLLTIAMLIASSCKERYYNTQELEVDNDALDFTGIRKVMLITIEDHEYIYVSGESRAGITHSANCKNPVFHP